MGDNKEGKKQPLRETIQYQLRVRSGGEDAAELLLEAVIWVMLVFFLLLPKLKSPGSGGEELHTHTPATKYLQYARQDAMHLARPHSKSSNCTASLLFTPASLEHFCAKAIRWGRAMGPQSRV